MSRFAILPAYVLDYPELRGSLMVLLALSTYADKHGWAYPSLARLSEQLGISRVAIHKHLVKLRAAGVIEIRAQWRADGSRGTNLYRIIMDRGEPVAPAEADGPLTPEVDGPLTPAVKGLSTPAVKGLLAPEVNARTTHVNYPYEHNNSPSAPPTGGSPAKNPPDLSPLPGAGDDDPPPSAALNDDPPLAADAADSVQTTRVPYQRIVDLYHELLPMAPRVRKLTAARQAQIRARWRAGELPDLATWADYFGYVAESRFLTGRQDPGPGRRPFVADLEWLIRESNFVKVWEGRYHGRR